MKNNHESYYNGNIDYTKFLENQSRTDFIKYTDWVKKLLPKGGKFLDVGCGPGVSLELINKQGYELHGIEVSDTSVKTAKSKGFDCILYNGRQIPFKSNHFDVVGSINVLEHVDDPYKFLKENLRVTKKGGYLIIVTPNFLSISSSYHYHTKGVKQKSSNILSTMKKILTFSSTFEKMEEIKGGNFQPDNDAVNVTNPITILNWAKKNKLKVIYWSSDWTYSANSPKWITFVKNSLDHGLTRVLMGSVFIVIKKSR